MSKNQAIEYLVAKIGDEDEPLFYFAWKRYLRSGCVGMDAHSEISRNQSEKLDEAVRIAVDMCAYEKKNFPTR